MYNYILYIPAYSTCREQSMFCDWQSSEAVPLTQLALRQVPIALSEAAVLSSAKLPSACFIVERGLSPARNRPAADQATTRTKAHGLFIQKN